MSDRVEALEREIEKLDSDEWRRLVEWFEERQASLWDEQIAADSAAGKLDFLILEAQQEKRAGELTDLFDGLKTQGE